MKTIAQQLNVKSFPFNIKDDNDNVIYFENANGYYLKREYTENNKVIYYEDSYGYWHKREYDENDNEIYFENSDGVKRTTKLTTEWDKRTTELTMDEIAKKFNIDVKNLKVIK